MTSEVDFDRSHLPHLAIYGCVHLPTHLNSRPLEARLLDEKVFVATFNSAIRVALETAGLEVKDAECSCTFVTYDDVKPHKRGVRALPVWGSSATTARGVRGKGEKRERVTLTREERFERDGVEVVSI